MDRNRWKITGVIATAVLGFASVAHAGLYSELQQPPKAPRAPQQFSYWVGDPQSAKGSYLGVDVMDISKNRVSALKLKDEHGVEVTMVDQDAPAGKAGLKEHDVILEFNSSRVEGEEQLKRMIHETPAGRTVTLSISRDGQAMQLPVTLAERSKTVVWSDSPTMIPRAPRIPAMPAFPAFPAMPEFDMPEVNVMVRSYSISAGMMVDNLTPQLGEYFGVKSGEGVLVRSVEKGSAAEAAGLKAGDVIVKVGDERISDRSDWRRALRDRKSAKLNLGIVRDKKEQNLTITLPASGKKDSSRLRGRTLRRDPDGDIIDDDDVDLDIDMDTDGETAALTFATRAQEMAMSEAKKNLLSAENTTAESMKQTLKEMQPKLQLEMKKMQQQIQEQIKRMEEQLRLQNETN